MKIQLASDLHLDMLGAARTWTLIEPDPTADVLVLAGDIDGAEAAVARFAKWPVPVIYVPGNHEFYDWDWQVIRTALQEVSEGTDFHVLDNGRVDLGGVRFLGCTLWTSFNVRGRTRSTVMDTARATMNDFYLIGNKAGTFTPEDALKDHEASCKWLEQQLAVPFDGPTVVVTHHAPHPLSIHPRYAGEALNGAFASDLTPLMKHVDLWLHGHVHDSFDYQVDQCRVVANPAGYALNGKAARTEAELILENGDFNSMLVIPVEVTKP